MLFAGNSVEVAVDRQFGVTRGLERIVPRSCLEGPLAASDGGPAPLPPVVESREVEQGPGLQPTRTLRDGEQDLPGAFGVTRLDEVVAQLERTPVLLVGRACRSQPNRAL